MQSLRVGLVTERICQYLCLMKEIHRPSKKADRSQQERDKNKEPFNPFEGRNKEEVWKEISKNGTSMTQPEMIEQLRAIAAEEKRKKQSS